jgi:ribonucleoside-diphosphate reductase alpha chain
MDFRDTGRAAGSDEMSDVLEAMDRTETKVKDAAPAPAPDSLAPEAAPEVKAKAGDSKTVDVRRFDVVTDTSRDDLLTEFGKETLKDRYLLPGENYQDLFARVASAYADEQAHAQRLYDYISRLWFMPATPVLSNGGTGRGLPA